VNWSSNAENLFALMGRLSVRDRTGQETGQEQGFLAWTDLAQRVGDCGGTIFFIGNGASASMASHMAADVGKNAGIRTEVFFDLALITALGNDIGYADVFAEPLRIKATEKDMLVAISSSGESVNIVKGVETADRSGSAVVTLSAMGEDNSLRGLGTLNFYLPAQTYGDAETCHAAVLHHWMDRLAAERIGAHEG